MFVMSHIEKQQPPPPPPLPAPAVAGKTAHPCDGCARWRARWYCVADDPFLCQSCDSSVHSANPLARRHHRLRIRSSSAASGGAPDVHVNEVLVPSWLRGFKRKARTPRPHQHAKKARPTTDVPELVETSVDENEDEAQQLLYRVPVFDPAVAEFRSPPSVDDANAPTSSGDEAKPTTMELLEPATPGSTSAIDTANRLASILSSDMELAEFAAKMESLLGCGLDGSDDSFSMETLGLVHSMEGDDGNNVGYCLDDAVDLLKAEQPVDAEHCTIDPEIGMTRETLELDFNFPGSSTAEEDNLDEENIELTTAPDQQEEEAKKQAKLRLNYEAVISAWSSHGSSPWTGGERPQINLDNCGWSDYMVIWAEGMGGGGAFLGGRHGGDTSRRVADVGRRARVTRYREKRRTRLFAKKIRYEVRKLNAEKRPRMKGRFVKRAQAGVLPH